MLGVSFVTKSVTFGDIGYIILSRERKLNALNLAMLMAITKQLQAWEVDDQIKCIIIRSNCPKAFCAGGDLKELYQRHLANEDLVEFFRLEYKLNLYLNRYHKPIISLLNGFVIGGGVGLGMHVRYPIATSNFQLSMPETKIGLFPDVGGRLILNKMPAPIALYYALTGRLLGVQEAINYKVINYYCASEQEDKLLDEIEQLATIEQLEYLLQNYRAQLTVNENIEYSAIIKHFSEQDNIANIFASLAVDGTEWADTVLAELTDCCRVSLELTFLAMQLVSQQDLAACLATDYRVIQRIIAAKDFYEGIRAKIIDKDNQPNWEQQQLSKQQLLEFFMPIASELWE